MSTYNGLFLRCNLDQVNTIPKPGAMSSSPDIVPSGTVPYQDPKAYLTSTYASDPGVSVTASLTNYIYLRGKNYSNTKINDSDANAPRLWYSESSLLSYPDKWNEITTTPSGKPASLVAEANSVGVIAEPFWWVPPPIPDGANYHYCMIAQAGSPGYDNSIPNTLQIGDFAGWVASCGGIAWRNIVTVNPTTLALTGCKMNYDQGTDAAAIQFTIVCSYLPVGSTISFSAGVPGPSPAIYLAPTVVSTSPSFTTGVVCNVPANYSSGIYFNFLAPAGVTQLDPKANVQIQAAYPSSPGQHLFEKSFTPSHLGIPTPEEAHAAILKQLKADNQPPKLQHYHEQYLDQLRDLQVQNGPKRLIVVGSNNYSWSGK